MKITFAGAVIAQTASQGGTDAVTGFFWDEEDTVQVEPICRAPWVKLFDRGNGVITLTGQITPAPADNLDEALLVRMLSLAALPRCGTLVFATANAEVTFPNAARKKPRIVKSVGVSTAIELTFLAVNPSQSNLPLQTDAGVDVETDSGQQINI